MKSYYFAPILLVLIGCADKQVETDKSMSLPEAREGFKTRLVEQSEKRQPAPDPPAQILTRVSYPSKVGDLVAYLTLDPKDGKKRPAILWITGGDCNSIDRGCWQEGPPKNDQSASAFRKAGIVMMFPSLRGGNDNPGKKEGFFGEVDDVLSAAEYVSKLNYVDPERIYLGGHSTGGTLVMLVAQSSDRFRAVFSFGPADNVKGYEPKFLPFNTSSRREVQLRSPGHWLHSVKCPLFVFEGTNQGNIDALNRMKAESKNELAKFIAVRGGDHFSVLSPVTRVLAEKIGSDTGPTCNFTFSEMEIR